MEGQSWQDCKVNCGRWITFQCKQRHYKWLSLNTQQWLWEDALFQCYLSHTAWKVNHEKIAKSIASTGSHKALQCKQRHDKWLSINTQQRLWEDALLRCYLSHTAWKVNHDKIAKSIGATGSHKILQGKQRHDKWLSMNTQKWLWEDALLQCYWPHTAWKVNHDRLQSQLRPLDHINHSSVNKGMTNGWV